MRQSEQLRVKRCCKLARSKKTTYSITMKVSDDASIANFTWVAKRRTIYVELEHVV